MAEAQPGAGHITSILQEARTFPPPPSFAQNAQVKGLDGLEKLESEARETPEKYWEQAAGLVHWFKRWDRVLDWDNPPFARWFVGGKTNLSYNCIDRHLGRRASKPALIWEGEPGEVRTLTYADMHREVSRFANVLKSHGVSEGDRVGIYMPMIPEAAIAMLACARIGAVHSVVFGGFSAEAVRERMNDAEAKLIVTADGGYRRGAEVPL